MGVGDLGEVGVLVLGGAEGHESQEKGEGEPGHGDKSNCRSVSTIRIRVIV